MLKTTNSVIQASQIATPITLPGDVTLSTGNLVPATAGKGVDFTANTGAAGMTSELFNWYEEGTWTPNQGAGLTLVGAFNSGGRYTRIGRQVTVTGFLEGATSIAISANGVMFTNMPFTAGGNNTAGGIVPSSRISGGQFVLESGTKRGTCITTISTVAYVEFSGTYFV